MTNTTKVCKWGNSYAIRLTKKFVHDAGLREGSLVDLNFRPIHTKSGTVRFELTITPHNNHKVVDFCKEMGKEVDF